MEKVPRDVTAGIGQKLSQQLEHMQVPNRGGTRCLERRFNLVL